MLKKEDPTYKKRHDLFEILWAKDVSMNIKAMLTDPMSGQPDEEKEKIAEVLLKIIERATTEREILEMAVKTFGTNVMTRAAKYLQSMEK